MELVANKGLIADFSLEDARVIHKREQRFERLKKINQDKKREAKKESRKDSTQKKTEVLPAVVELGKSSKSESEQKKTISIDHITDQEVLYRMLRETNSRGKRQRIKKRLAFLRGEKLDETKAPAVSNSNEKP